MSSGGTHKKLTFSDYFSFFHTRNGNELTYDQLVQVLFIHGFIKSRAHKHEVLEALGSFVLMDPTRSMTNKGGSPLLGGGQVATPSLEQIRRDIDEIGWEECSIGSIQIIQPAQIAVKEEESECERGRVEHVKNYGLVVDKFLLAQCFS